MGYGEVSTFTTPGTRWVRGRHIQRPERTTPMLWTILIILAIVALVLFILSRVRGGRGV
jgi:hypothetical protein